MPMPNRAGRFRGPIIDAGVSENRNQKTVVALKHSLDEQWHNGEWCDVRHEGFEMTSYHNLEKNDGNLNDRAIDSLVETLGWNGSDLSWFQRDPLPPACQVTLEFETWEGKERLKAKWINPYDSTGGMEVTKADDATLRAINNRLGAKLRARSGGTPVATPKPAGAPAAPPPARQSPPSMSKADYKAASWEAFCAAGVRDGHEQALIDSVWQEAIALFNKLESEITESEWLRISNAGPTDIMNATANAANLPF